MIAIITGLLAGLVMSTFKDGDYYRGYQMACILGLILCGAQAVLNSF